MADPELRSILHPELLATLEPEREPVLD